MNDHIQCPNFLVGSSGKHRTEQRFWYWGQKFSPIVGMHAWEWLWPLCIYQAQFFGFISHNIPIFQLDPLIVNIYICRCRCRCRHWFQFSFLNGCAIYLKCFLVCYIFKVVTILHYNIVPTKYIFGDIFVHVFGNKLVRQCCIGLSQINHWKVYCIARTISWICYAPPHPSSSMYICKKNI